MLAYNLTFGGDAPRPDAERIGWIGTNGPAIDPTQWPRDAIAGLPMLHAFTIRLPEAYRRQGPELPGIAFFQGPYHPDLARSGTPDAGSPDPFLRDLARAGSHPRRRVMHGMMGDEFALLWLTEDELRGTPATPPPDTRRPGERRDRALTPNAWDSPAQAGPVWLTPREDPNAGRAPRECPEAGDDYEPPEAVGGGWKGWAEPLTWDASHLGGTCFPDQGVPHGLTPYYLEVVDFGAMNLGGGSAQIDLESDTFDWACG